MIYLSIYIGLIATTFYILSFAAGRKRKRRKYTDDELPFVSVLIPAYNEEKSIARTIKSILKSDYPKFEVIVIDDGSKDKTYKIAKKFHSGKVRVYTKKNGGKGTALNLGIKKAKGKIIFTMDADTFVEPQSMKNMVRSFKEPKVMSVTPAMMIHKPKTILQRVQYIEYVLGLFLRKAFASLDAIYVAPGAFSAYRKSFFEKHGGYEVGNITEDLEMALRIQSKGYLTENCPDAPVYTIAPARFKELLMQRRRWYFGLIKNTWAYRRIFGRKYGDLGMFVLPIAWISIFFAVLITSYLFIKTLFNVRSNLMFLYNVNFDFASIMNFNLLTLERTIFLFFTNPVVIYILIFMVFLRFYMAYAAKKVGKISNKYFNLTLFFILFAVLFGFWWIVSIFYAIFYREIKWS
jgi:cellulose synthase/poly-beta-1,6-N-acetylglucosamine synthase-like glycosyltransferase